MVNINDLIQKARAEWKSEQEIQDAIAKTNQMTWSEFSIADPIDRNTIENRVDTNITTTENTRTNTPTDAMMGNLDFWDSDPTTRNQWWFTGVGVFSSSQQQPTQEFRQLTGNENFLKFWQEASQLENQMPWFLTNRNDVLAQNFASQDISDPAEVFQQLSQYEWFANSDLADQENTVRAIVDRIWQLQTDWNFQRDAMDTWFQDFISRINNQAELEKQEQIDRFAQDIGRWTQLYDRKLNDLETQFEIRNRNLDRQRENFAIKVENEIEDVMRTAERNIDMWEKIWALKWFNRSSWYAQWLENIKQDALRNVQRLQAQKERALQATQEDREVLLQEYNRNLERVKEDFNFQMRDLMDLASFDLTKAVDEYWFSDEKLWERISEISLDVEERKQNLINSYISNMSAINSVKSQEIDDIIRIQNFYNQQEDRFIWLLNQNEGQALLNLSPTQLIDYVEQWYLSPQSAQAYTDLLFGKTISTLQANWRLESNDITEIANLLNSGLSPLQVITKIIEDNPNRFTVSTDVSGTSPTIWSTSQVNIWQQVSFGGWNYQITQFGWSPTWGIDLAPITPWAKEPVWAFLGGTVVRTGTDSDWNNFVELLQDNWYVYRYNHLDSFADLQEWQRINQWEIIGIMWNTGKTMWPTGVHLDVWIYDWQRANNPNLWPLDITQQKAIMFGQDQKRAILSALRTWQLTDSQRAQYRDIAMKEWRINEFIQAESNKYDNSQITKLKQDIIWQQVYKDMSDIAKWYDNILGIYGAWVENASGFEDISAINALQRMIDPWATVREWDVTLVQSAIPIFKRISPTFKWNQFTEWDVLPASLREKLLQTAENIYQSQAQSYNQTIQKLRWNNFERAWTSIQDEWVLFDVTTPTTSNQWEISQQFEMLRESL